MPRWKGVNPMLVKNIYPAPAKEKRARQRLIRILRWPFAFTAYLCPILNIATGGQAWSLVVLWSLWLTWSHVISPALVEVNRISQLIKLLTNASILLILIDLVLSPGWAVEVVPIVCFSGLLVAGILFFTDLERQRQNMLPMLLFCAAAIVSAVVGLIAWREQESWPMVVMGALALALLIGCVCVLGIDFLRELKKRFYAK